jgi:hypothetical protein
MWLRIRQDTLPAASQQIQQLVSLKASFVHTSKDVSTGTRFYSSKKCAKLIKVTLDLAEEN